MIFTMMALCFGDVVNNPEATGSKSIIFEEVLRFGAIEPGDEYLWFDSTVPANLDVNQKGEIYVLDPKGKRVLHFTEKGEFVDVLVKAGEGPGEANNPTFFQLMERGAMVSEPRGASVKFTFFDNDYAYESVYESMDLSKLVARASFSPKGTVAFGLVMEIDTTGGPSFFKSAILDREFNVIEYLSSTEWPIPDPSRFGDPSYWSELIGKQMNGLMNQGNQQVAFYADGSLLINYPHKYQIDERAADGKTLVKSINKAYKPIAMKQSDTDGLGQWLQDTIFEQAPQLAQIVNDQTIKKALELADLPEVKPPVYFIIPIENLGFLALREVNFADESFNADLFLRDGTCIGHVDSPSDGLADLFGPRMVFKNGKAYTMMHNEDGDNEVVVYNYEIR